MSRAVTVALLGVSAVLAGCGQPTQRVCEMYYDSGGYAENERARGAVSLRLAISLNEVDAALENCPRFRVERAAALAEIEAREVEARRAARVAREAEEAARRPQTACEDAAFSEFGKHDPANPTANREYNARLLACAALAK
jgi:hypothetical protein